jgi:hypothetical protein
VLLATASVIFLRVGVAWMMALVGSAACVVMACVLIDRGALNPAPAPIVRGGAALTDGSSAPMLGEAEPTPRDLTPTLFEALARCWTDGSPDAGFVARSVDAWRHVRARGDAWWARLPSTTQTLVSAFGWGGFAAGFIAAIFFPRPVAVLLTSVLGSSLAVSVLASLVERLSSGRFAVPARPAPWLMFLAAGAVLGVLMQASRAAGAAPARASEAEPDPDHG